MRVPTAPSPEPKDIRVTFSLPGRPGCSAADRNVYEIPPVDGDFVSAFVPAIKSPKDCRTCSAECGVCSLFWADMESF